jgi:glutamate--cysteine ligase
MESNLNQNKINTKEELDLFVAENWHQINDYLDQQFKLYQIPVYTSIDIRESDSKYSPVDNNLYPAGFNNICKKDQMVCQEHFKQALSPICKNIIKVGLIPESHTKNLFYLDHLFSLKSILERAGFEVELLTTDSTPFEGSDQLKLISHSGHALEINLAHYEQGVLKTRNHNGHCIYLLNNDQSSPLDLPWNDFKVPVVPSPHIGWFRRQKNEHFKCYEMVANQFSQYFSIAPQLIQAKFKAIEGVDFNAKEGLDQIADAIDEMQKELPEHTNIFVKASQGTYGMGIMVVQNGDEIRNMNRKDRNKMDIGKNKIKFTKVLVQEGVETIIKYDGHPAEVTIYLVNGTPVGGFMRANPERDTKSNLNAKGMVYQKFCLSEMKEIGDDQFKQAVYCVIARLSTLASALEIQNVLADK